MACSTRYSASQAAATAAARCSCRPRALPCGAAGCGGGSAPRARPVRRDKALLPSLPAGSCFVTARPSLELPLFLPAEIATDKPARRYRCPQESCNYDLCSSCIFRGQERVPSQTVSLTAKSKARASRASKASRASPRARPVTAGRSGWAEPADPGPATREPRRQEQQQVAGHVTKKRKKCGRQTHSLSSAVATAH